MPGFSTFKPLPLEQPPLIMVGTLADVWQALFLMSSPYSQCSMLSALRC